MLNKIKVINLAKEIFTNEISDYSNLFISKTLVTNKFILDYSGHKIFPEINDNVTGWLVFFDPFIFRNWEHSCTYVFITDNEKTEMKFHTKPYIDESIFEKI